MIHIATKWKWASLIRKFASWLILIRFTDNRETRHEPDLIIVILRILVPNHNMSSTVPAILADRGPDQVSSSYIQIVHAKNNQ